LELLWSLESGFWDLGFEIWDLNFKIWDLRAAGALRFAPLVAFGRHQGVG
jgi:hypothetical protein